MPSRHDADLYISILGPNGPTIFWSHEINERIVVLRVFDLTSEVQVGTQATSPSQTIILPKEGGALKGLGEKFSPDLHTGTGNFSIPIQGATVPPPHRIENFLAKIIDHHEVQLGTH